MKTEQGLREMIEQVSNDYGMLLKAVMAYLENQNDETLKYLQSVINELEDRFNQE